MINVDDGQCGRCLHFGEDHGDSEQLVQIRVSGKAPEGYTDSCGHPRLDPMHLRVSAVGSCDGFEPA